ncbi:MAG: hypothetical protein P8J50_08090 [Acidimicrobiales bacterium]|nr:hypothetical protein [Acidimicrobiales bacterium]
MSVQVPLDDLAAVAADYGPTAYVLIGAAEGPPRVTHSEAQFLEGLIEVSIGRRATAALAANPTACLLWPAPETDAMSLIVDVVLVGGAPADGGVTRFDPVGAVRHRPA